jgi:MFS family permease
MFRSQILDYLHFLKSDWRMLLFGFLMVFCSSFGQTFFIGVFTPSIENHFELSHSEWGVVFMVGTLLSALILPLTGSLLDRTPLRTYSVFVSCFLGLACFSAGMSNNVFLLVLAVFLLRHAGQGLATHTAQTGTLKYFESHRGKAVAVVGLGFPIARAILPVTAIFCISVIGWQATYILCGLLVLACMLPSTLLLLPLRPGPLSNATNKETTSATIIGKAESGVTLKKALTSPLFYLLIPGFLVPSFLDTALAFHVLLVAELKHWPGIWVLSGYTIYGVMSIIASVCAGPILDRFGSKTLLNYSLGPSVLGLIVLIYCNHPIWAFVYLGLFGIVSGLRMTLIPFALSELYGIRYIASIRSFVAALSVFASALGPPVLGLFLDLGFTITTIGAIYILYLIPAIALTMLATRLYLGNAKKS